MENTEPGLLTNCLYRSVVTGVDKRETADRDDFRNGAIRISKLHNTNQYPHYCVVTVKEILYVGIKNNFSFT